MREYEERVRKIDPGEYVMLPAPDPAPLAAHSASSLV
jgi:hypothetical protein